MCESGSLHRSAEIEDLTHLTDQDKKKLSEEAEKGKNLLQSNEQTDHATNSSLQDLNKTSFNQQKLDPK
jgi:hypothetical protein